MPFARRFRRRSFLILTALMLLPIAALAASEDLHFVRIGAGTTGGTYFPIAGVIANAISNPPGSRPCEVGGSCGVPGMIAVAQSSEGSVENVRLIDEGRMDTGMTQSDVAYRAYQGIGEFKGKKRLEKIRAMASLFPEMVHLVVTVQSGIKSIKELKGKRVNLGQDGSGTLEDALLILDAYKLPEKRLKSSHLKLEQAVDKMQAGELDAFFMIGGAPLEAIRQLSKVVPIDLIPITGKGAEAVRVKHPFMTKTIIPAGTYASVDHDTETLGVAALWVTSETADPDMVYGMLKALWHPNNKSLLAKGHPLGRFIDRQTALEGIAIPLHPGAWRFYDEEGLTLAARESKPEATEAGQAAPTEAPAKGEEKPKAN